VRKIKYFLLFCLLSFFSVQAQQVIENPKKPLAKNPGRTLGLKEVLRITDTGEQYYFQGSPGGFSSEGIDSDGFLYIRNGKDQILKFTPTGKFLKNIIRGGQGPGEVSSYFTFLVGGRDIFIFDFGQYRIIRITADGELVHQWTVRRPYDDFLGILGDFLLFSRANYPPLEERRGKLTDIPHEILLVSKDGLKEKLVHTFSVLRFLAQNAAAFWAPFHAALSEDGRFLFVNHTAEYGISVLDLETGKIIKNFRRKYPRIKHYSDSREAQFFKVLNFKRPYEADIADLYVFNNRLWVKTSTVDKEKTSLFDVFNFDGTYLDAFILKKNLIAVQNGRLMIWETDADGNPSFVIYAVGE
jgi:hypothetical protein